MDIRKIEEDTLLGGWFQRDGRTWLVTGVTGPERGWSGHAEAVVRAQVILKRGGAGDQRRQFRIGYEQVPSGDRAEHASRAIRKREEAQADIDYAQGSLTTEQYLAEKHRIQFDEREGHGRSYELAEALCARGLAAFEAAKKEASA